MPRSGLREPPKKGPIPLYVLAGAQEEFVFAECRHPAMLGGRGCIAAETLVEGVPVADRVVGGQVRTLAGESYGTRAYVKGQADLYRVVTESGREALVTLDHRFLARGSWRPLRDLAVGDDLAADGTWRGGSGSRTASDNRFWDKITGISFVRHGDFYDLTVPYQHHYSAQGLWHHNSSKTTANVIKGFVAAGNQPGALGCLTSPTYVQLRDNMMPAWRQMFGETEGSGWEFRRADMELRFANGSTILLRPANEPDRLRGLSLAFFGMDEIAIGEQFESFIILQAALRQRNYKHQGWVTSTPHWRKPWIRQIWQDLRNPMTKTKLPPSEYVIYRASTADNTFLPDAFVENLRAMAPSERYARQELYGEFIDVEGVAFPQFSERTHVRMPPEGMKVKKRVMGVDFGGTVPTAVIEMVLLENGELQATWEFYERNCSEMDLVRAISDRQRTKVLCDPSGSMQIDQLKRYGINAVGARSNKFDMRKRLWTSRLNLMNRSTGKTYDPGQPGAEYAKPGIYISPNCPNLINELQNLAHASDRRETPLDKWEQGLDDHAFDAGAYAIMELDPGSFKVSPLRVDWKLNV